MTARTTRRALLIALAAACVALFAATVELTSRIMAWHTVGDHS